MASPVDGSSSSTLFTSLFSPSSESLSIFSPNSSFRRIPSSSQTATRAPSTDELKQESTQKKRKHDKQTPETPTTEARNSSKLSRAAASEATSLHAKESDRKRKLEHSGSAPNVKGKKEAASDSSEWNKHDEFLQDKGRKREGDDSPEQKTLVKKRKVNSEQMSNEHQRSESRLKDIVGKFDASIQVGLNADSSKVGAKRKKEENIEAIYEKRFRNGKSPILARVDASANEDDKQISEETGKKRKRDKLDLQSAKSKTDDQLANGANTGIFDDQEKLSRTIFVGNLPLKVKKKAVIKEFSQFGPIHSVRLRSVPLLDTKIPTRKGAIIKGQINEAINSQHAYIVFQEASHANAALSHNMKEFNGNHLRVDAAYVPHKATNGKSLSYDYTRTIFVGNLPFDVKDEELYQIFTPEMNVEAIRVVRDSRTSLSKGIAFVLFKTKESADRILSSRKKTKLRDRMLRITRAQRNLSQSASPKQRNLSQSTSPKHVKLENDDDETGIQRKRAKLSASYEGIRAKKEVKQRRHNLISGKSQKPKEPMGKEGSLGAAGSKRKRAEKRQRGTSRSKKIRRT